MLLQPTTVSFLDCRHCRPMYSAGMWWRFSVAGTRRTAIGENVWLHIWIFIWGRYPTSAQHPPCLPMSVYSKVHTQRITKWRHSLYSTKGAWQFCKTPFPCCSVTNETFVAELFLTNGVSVNLFGFGRQLSVSASTCRNSRKSLPPRCGGINSAKIHNYPIGIYPLFRWRVLIDRQIDVRCVPLYTVIHKIGTPLYFCNNFFKCWSIWMNITSLYSLGNLLSGDVVCNCIFHKYSLYGVI